MATGRADAYECWHLTQVKATVLSPVMWWGVTAAENQNRTFWETNNAPGYEYKCTGGGNTYNIQSDADSYCYSESGPWTSTFRTSDCYWYVSFWYYYVFSSTVLARYAWEDSVPCNMNAFGGCYGQFWLYADVNGDDTGRGTWNCYYHGYLNKGMVLHCSGKQYY
jgi:hypothetical protein